jgi:hypothetical protein
MTDREVTDGGRHMATDDRRTLGAIFHHPVPHNLSCMDTLHLLTHLGSASERADGKYSLTINGKPLIFHKPHDKHLDARQITDLRRFFASSGISPDNPYGTPATAESTWVDVVGLIDHHGAKLYRIHLSSDQRAETVTPYDRHHFLHHLHHRDETREQGQTVESKGRPAAQSHHASAVEMQTFAGRRRGAYRGCARDLIESGARYDSFPQAVG